MQMCIVELVLKSYCLVGLPLVKRLIIGGLGAIRVFSLLKVSLRLVGLVLSVVPWLRL